MNSVISSGFIVYSLAGTGPVSVMRSYDGESASWPLASN